MSRGLEKLEARIFPCVKKFQDVVAENKKVCDELIDEIHSKADLIREHFIKRGMK